MLIAKEPPTARGDAGIALAPRVLGAVIAVLVIGGLVAASMLLRFIAFLPHAERPAVVRIFTERLRMASAFPIASQSDPGVLQGLVGLLRGPHG